MNQSTASKSAAAAKSELDTTHELARRCLDGDAGVANDEAPDIKALERLVSKGHADAQYGLGLCFHHGLGIAQDLGRAAALYQQAADQGHARAQYNLGRCYASGEGVVKDEQRAVALYRQAADQGDADAQFNLAGCLMNGKGVDKDDRHAAALYQDAAKQGRARAQYNLGCYYRDGEGVAKDLVRAAEFFQLAADQGDADAQYHLGNAFHSGKGVQKDLRRAVQMWQLAADQSHAISQHTLAVFLFHGHEYVPQNINLAYKLCKLAVGHGFEHARDFLVVIKAALEPRACAGARPLSRWCARTPSASGAASCTIATSSVNALTGRRTGTFARRWLTMPRRRCAVCLRACRSSAEGHPRRR